MSIPPILSIPMEITQIIMQDALAATIANTGCFPRPFTWTPPLLFTRICKEWRDISLNTPELWQAIQVDDRSTPAVPPEVVSLWSSRAANRPRYIRLEHTSLDVGPRVLRRAEALLKESMKSCEQWCDVRLVFPIQAFSALIARRGPFPMLRSLHICPKYAIHAALAIPIRDAPLLRTVTLDVISLLSLKTAWEQLSTLDITVHNPGSKFYALRRCSNLVNLRVTLYSPTSLHGKK
ncbi:hypothetical protein DFH06DRAFT_542744 [Mycena polygramma]|nr:hypothetical protein DFH06DRAFT_542744 [Mycena polygramma]